MSTGHSYTIAPQKSGFAWKIYTPPGSTEGWCADQAGAEAEARFALAALRIQAPRPRLRHLMVATKPELR